MGGFSSGLAGPIASLVRQKHVLGFDYATSARHLEAFDAMCADRFPGQTALTKDMAMAWATLRPGEHPNGLLRRVTPVRQLGKHMAGLGLDAWPVPARLPGGRTRYTPHVFTHDEIAALFAAVDACPRPPCGGWRDLVAPTAFRLLYCLGLRPSEASRLAVNDVGLASGRVLIRESKGHRDRVVLMGADLAEYCRAYDAAIAALCPTRQAFLPNPWGRPYSASTLGAWFHEFWDQLDLPRQARISSPARLYDLRHTHVVHLIGSWAQSGEDINRLMPYLNTHLGHAHYDDTWYYFHLVPEHFDWLAGLSAVGPGPRLPEARDA
jgi:integrase